MKSLWNEKQASKFKNNPLAMRVYTSQLLGKNPELVLHGGGNTSVKAKVKNVFGETEDILYVKGSGWDLATIEAQGFAPVRMDVLLKMAKLAKCSDSQMVEIQRSAMTNPYAPNPSVEAILHAIIPYTFVDHTHADSVVTLTNTPNGEKIIREIYGPNMFIVPYIMPGFILAKAIYDMTRNVDWESLDGMVLLNHGVFTFDHDPKTSYEKMIRIVTKAEDYLSKKVKLSKPVGKAKEDLLSLARVRQGVCKARKKPVLAKLCSTKEHISFANRKDLDKIATRGPITPDHIIRTKRIPALLNSHPEKDVQKFVKDYFKYFEKYANGHQTPLDPAPRWGVWAGYGTLAFGHTLKEIEIITDISRHTILAIQRAEKLGGWKTLSEKTLFEMEYWELEQAKLKKGSSSLPYQGKIALVTGAASGIGKACVDVFAKQGAVVVALDIDSKIKKLFSQPGVVGVQCDLTKEQQVKKAVAHTVREFGGLDIVISNAGIFPESESLDKLQTRNWEKSLDINLSSHQMLLKQTIPFLEYGVEPTVVIVASKNVPAPGPGAGAYSVAKAGLTQLSRIAALELAQKGIRVNVLHPNQVFDTAIWTPAVLKKRAQNYGISIDEYKKNNLLKVSITSQDVAELACTVAGPVFANTTGCQIPIDGGNERVI